MRQLSLALLGLFALLLSGCGGSEPRHPSYEEALRFVPNDEEFLHWIGIVNYEGLRSLSEPDGAEGLSTIEGLALRAETYAAGFSSGHLGRMPAAYSPRSRRTGNLGLA